MINCNNEKLINQICSIWLNAFAINHIITCFFPNKQVLRNFNNSNYTEFTEFWLFWYEWESYITLTKVVKITPHNHGFVTRPVLTCIITWWNSPSLSGDIRWRPTLDAPALSPIIVTLLGSPPKAMNSKKYKQEVIGKTSL